MNHTKREKRNVPEFYPPELKFIESIRAIKDLEKMGDPPIVKRSFFQVNPKCYAYEINYPIYSQLKQIQSKAFSYLNLYSITLPPSLTTIFPKAFKGCIQLHDIIFMKNGFNICSLLHIGNEAFRDTCISSIKIPSSVKEIGLLCFPKSLATIEFEDGCPNLEKLGDNTFNSTSLVTINFPSHILNYQNCKTLFYKCKTLKHITFDHSSDVKPISSLQDIRNANKQEYLMTSRVQIWNLFDISQDFARSYLLSQLVVPRIQVASSELNFLYFYDTPQLLSIEIPTKGKRQLVKLSKCVYTTDMKKLIVAERDIESVTIDSKCEIITNYAFNTHTLKSVDFPRDSHLQEISFSSFYNSRIEKLNIPDSVDLIDYGAFAKCNQLIESNIPKSLKLLDYFIFAYTNLRKIIIPKNVTQILYGSFMGCHQLNEVVFENDSHLIEIDDYAFSCTDLSTIRIPKTVEMIGSYSFANCRNLSSIQFEDISNIKSVGTHTFLNTQIKNNDIGQLLIKINLFNHIGRYRNPCIVNSVTYIEIPSTVEEIGPWTFSYCQNLTTIKITNFSNSRLKRIKQGAFYNCTALKTFDIPSTVTHYGLSSFTNCYNYNPSINCFSSELVYIGRNAFQNSGIVEFASNCRKITIGQYAFENCRKLKTFSTSASRYCYIRQYAFSNCSSIDTVALNTNVSEIEIDSYCFMSSSIKSFSLPEYLKVIPECCFKSCKQLKDINIKPYSFLRIISNEAFADTLIEKIFIPRYTKYFNSECFKNCANLKEIIFEEESQLLEIADSAFSMSGIKHFTIPKRVKLIGYGCFANCSNLSSVDFPKQCKIKAIADKVFKSTGIVNIEFPSSVLCFGHESFQDCTKLQSVIFNCTLPMIYFSTFANCNKLVQIILPQQIFEKGSRFDHYVEHPIIYDFYHYIYYNYIEKRPNKSSLILCDDKMKYFYLQFGSDEINQNTINAFITSNINKQSNQITEYMPGNDSFLCGIFVVNDEIRYHQTVNAFATGMRVKLCRFENGVCYSFLKESLLCIDFSTESVTVPNETSQLIASAFAYSQLKKIYFPVNSQLRVIGAHCFKRCQIQEIRLPDSLEVIEEFAFDNCRQLSKVVISKNCKLTSIGQYAFTNSAITSIVFPSSLTTIHQYAFFNCYNLKEVENHSTQPMEFHCYSFTNTAIDTISFSPKCVFHHDCFANCKHLKQLSFITSPINLYFDTFSFACTGLESLSIVCQATFHESSFAFCNNLSKVKISSDITLIGYPFYNSGIKAIFIQGKFQYYRSHSYEEFERDLTREIWRSGIKQLHFHFQTIISSKNDDIKNDRIVRFYFNHNCLSINQEIVDSYLINNYNLFLKDTSQSEIKFNEILKISTDVVSMKNLSYSPHIKQISFAENSAIKYLSSFSCHNLIEITIPKSVVEIYPYMFDHCHYLRKVEFETGSKIKEIPTHAFSNTKIENIVLPDSAIVIKSYAFAYNKSLNTVVFNGEIIEDSAFLYTGLTSFNLSNNVQTIGCNAFQYCPNLKEFNIDTHSKLQEIHEYSFANSGIVHFSIPSQVNCISQFAFNDCPFLKTITIYSKLTVIEDFAFGGDISLQKINIPSTIEHISSTAFVHTPSLISIMKESNSKFMIGSNGEVYRKTNFEAELLFLPRNSKQFSPINCSIICSSAFSSAKLTTLELPGCSLRIIEKGAFANSPYLKKIIIPNSIVQIEDEAFMNCPNLDTVIFEKNIQLKEIPKYCFAFSGLTTINFPESLEIIDDMSFYLCDKLENIDIFNTNVKYIGNSSFASTSISRVVFPPTTQYIGSLAFANIKSLQTIDFSYCTELRTWDILPETQRIRTCRKMYKLIKKCNLAIMPRLPSSLRISSSRFSKRIQLSSPSSDKLKMKHISICSIHKYAFLHISASFKFNISEFNCFEFLEYCDNVYTYTINPNISLFLQKVNKRNPFTKTSSNKNYRIRKLICQNDYNLASEIIVMLCSLSAKLTVVDIGNLTNLDKIPQFAFAYSKVEQVYLPKSLRKICTGAFSSCENLERVVFAQNSILSTIMKFAFYECKSLHIIALPNTINEISFKCFALSGLTSIDIPKSITTINKYAFYQCSQLVNIKLNEGLISILESAFSFNTNLKVITLPNSIKSIGKDAFSSCFLLSKVIITQNSQLESLAQGVFDSTQIEEIILGPKIQRIYPLLNVPNLKKINFHYSTPGQLINGKFKVHNDGTVYSHGRTLELIFAPKNLSQLTIPSFCESIHPVALQGMENLTKIEYAKVAPNIIRNQISRKCWLNIKEISILGETCELIYNSFYTLESVVFDKSTKIDSIPSHAFMNCRKLKKVSISNCSSIGSSAFENCINLQTFELGSSMITDIGSRAFYNCISLPHFHSHVTSSISKAAFMNCESLKSVNLSIFSSDTTANFNVSSIYIKDLAFANCKSLEKYVLNIPCFYGSATFMNCNQLKSLKIIHNSLDLILPYRLFYNCTSLENVEISVCAFTASVQIGPQCFMNCRLLKEFIIDDKRRDFNIEQIKEKKEASFDLQEFEFQHKQIIRRYAFFNCESLKHVRIFDARIDIIESHAFGNCTSLSILELGSKFEMKSLRCNLNQNPFIGANKKIKIRMYNPNISFQLSDLVYLKEEKKHCLAVNPERLMKRFSTMANAESINGMWFIEEKEESKNFPVATPKSKSQPESSPSLKQNAESQKEMQFMEFYDACLRNHHHYTVLCDYPRDNGFLQYCRPIRILFRVDNKDYRPHTEYNYNIPVPRPPLNI